MIFMLQVIKDNWFQAVIVILLVLCYLRLGEIEKQTFATADSVEASATRIINANGEYLNRIEQNTESTYIVLEDKL